MTQTNPAYLLLKTAVAPKLGQRSEGAITYAILVDGERKLFITITANAGGGQFGRDIVPLSAVERCLPADKTLPFPAKVFAPSFTSRSSNNPGFMAAILRAEGLLGPVPDKAHLHLVAGDWEAWKAAMLALPGEPYVPVAKQAGTKTAVDDQPKTVAETDAGKVQVAAVDPDSPAEPASEAPKAGRKNRGRKAKVDAEAGHAPAE